MGLLGDLGCIGPTLLVNGAACRSSSVCRSLVVFVGSAVGLMVRVVSVSRVLSLSFAVLGLVVTSAAVEAIVVMSESSARAQGDSGAGAV